MTGSIEDGSTAPDHGSALQVQGVDQVESITGLKKLDPDKLLSTRDEYFERFGITDFTLEELKVTNKFVDSLIQDQIDNEEVLTKAGCRRLCMLGSYIDEEISLQELVEERVE